MRTRAIITVLACTLALFLYQSWRYRSLEREYMHVRSAYAAADTLSEIRAGVWEKLATEANSTKLLLAVIRADNERLYDALRKERAKPASVTTVTVVADPETLYAVSTQSSVSQSTGIGVQEYRFESTLERVRVHVDSMTATAYFEPKPFTINVVLTGRNGVFSTFVTTIPVVTVTAINTTVLNTNGWWERNRRWAYAGAGASVIGWVLTGKIGYALPIGALVVMEALHR